MMELHSIIESQSLRSKASQRKVQNAQAPPCGLKPSKRNLHIFRCEVDSSFCLVFPRMVYDRSWMPTAEALQVWDFPERKILANQLISKGKYWLKTGYIRNVNIPAGTHTNQAPYWQTGYEVHNSQYNW